MLAGPGDRERGSKRKEQKVSHGQIGIARTDVAQRGDMPDPSDRPRVFLISPATAHGPRATMLRKPGSGSSLARRLREGGVPLGDVFSFLSGFYFRGKLEYARAFARAREASDRIRVITMTDGLVSPDATIAVEDLERYALCSEGTAAAAATLERTASTFSQRIGPGAEVVLLGSVSTGKYTDLLAPIFGERLLFPRDVLHIGQLARGALFLRRAHDGEELEYVPVSEIARAGRRASIKGGLSPLPVRDATTETPLPAPRPSTEDARADARQ